MKCLVIYTHPNPKSFNAAIKEHIVSELEKNGHDVSIRDLYELGFNSILSADDFVHFQKGEVAPDIEAEQNEIKWADTLFFVFPTWWENMPAMLRGYIDRVFSTGFAYKYSDEGPIGLLKGKKAVILQTTGSPEEVLDSSNLLSSMKKVIGNGIFSFVGIETIAHKFFFAVPFISNDERKKMLSELVNFINNEFPKGK
ncbi:NAD(P)H-dependent oxidoreductase [Brassicibacter mesophilus]|uniref:NAD(P)H-dependent oxidoreductase n=1 Tax=Brassicibacter mesophilus TaxID=745119 RepID=UPI003D19C6A4